MSFPRSLAGAFAIALVVASVPASAHAQSRRRTACNDGTTVSSSASNACDKHGGINKGRTAVVNRTPTKQMETTRVAQAGKPAERAKPRDEEHRGWRWWGRHDDKKAEKREKHEKHERTRCKDGSLDPAHGKGKQLCKHHGGTAN